MNWIKILTIFTLALTLSACTKNSKQSISWKEEDGYVPNQESAIKIAEVVLSNIYPDIENETPFTAILVNGGIWHVTGTLNSGGDGGTAFIEIQKVDGKILVIGHGR